LGREVFVVPGTIDRPGFRGSHNLIRDGATLVDDPAQVISSLGFRPVAVAANGAGSNEVQRKILETLTVDPQAPEKFASALGLDSAQVMSELTMMEIEGLVVKSATGYAIKP
jgi:DNA processing protein